MSDQDLNLERLKKIDCCALSDALDRLKLKGVVSGLARQSGKSRIAGRAVTVKLGLGAPQAGPARHLGATAIDMAGPNNIIVVEQRTGVDAGSWGGMLTLGAKVRAVQGVVVDGPIRDVDEARDLGFNIFSTSLTAFTARGRIVEKGTNVPVTLRGVEVLPGAYIVADSSAVIVIDEKNVEEVLQAAEEIIAKEAVMAKALLSGQSVSDVMGGNYENMLKG